LGATDIEEFQVGFEVILIIGTADWVQCSGKNRGRKMDWTALWVQCNLVYSKGQTEWKKEDGESVIGLHFGRSAIWIIIN